MEYSIESLTNEQILIQIDDAKDELALLEDEFRKCSTENCSCQSDELQKLDFMNIQVQNDCLEVTLTPLANNSFNLEEIENFVVSILSYVYLIDGEEQPEES